ncbi:MAG: hypothetical protein R6V57_05665 [Vicinamibacterales bacterium]
MRRLTGMVIVACTLLQGGCHLRVPPSDVPAVLTSPTSATRAELVRVVSEAMNGAPVTIADNALTADDLLIVERAQQQSAKDMNLGGRETGRPHHFRLVKSGSRCVLIHQETGRRWTLTSATCSSR